MNCGGAMEIQDGEMTVSSAEDGIQADGDLTISGGTVQVTTTGEVAASAQDDFQPGNFGGGTPPSGEMPSGDAPSGNPPELPDGETFGGGNPPSGNAPSGDVPGQNGQNANAENADVIQAAAVQTDTTAASVTDGHSFRPSYSSGAVSFPHFAVTGNHPKCLLKGLISQL